MLAVQLLYRFDLTDCSLADVLDVSWMNPKRREALSSEAHEFAQRLVIGSINDMATVDACIDQQLEHWDMERLSRVDLAILRMSVYCLMHERDVPASVTINEAVEIAKSFGSNDSYRFVNGVLDGVVKKAEGTKSKTIQIE